MTLRRLTDQQRALLAAVERQHPATLSDLVGIYRSAGATLGVLDAFEEQGRIRSGGDRSLAFRDGLHWFVGELSYEDRARVEATARDTAERLESASWEGS